MPSNPRPCIICGTQEPTRLKWLGCFMFLCPRDRRTGQGELLRLIKALASAEHKDRPHWTGSVGRCPCVRETQEPTLVNWFGWLKPLRPRNTRTDPGELVRLVYALVSARRKDRPRWADSMDRCPCVRGHKDRPEWTGLADQWPCVFRMTQGPTMVNCFGWVVFVSSAITCREVESPGGPSDTSASPVVWHRSMLYIKTAPRRPMGKISTYFPRASRQGEDHINLICETPLLQTGRKLTEY